MKKTAFILLILGVCSIGYGQMNTLFYRQPWEKIFELKDSVMAVIPSYKLYKSTIKPSEYVENRFELRDSITNSNLTSVEIGVAQLSDGTIGVVEICGPYDLIFPVFKSYIKKKAVKGDKEFSDHEYGTCCIKKNIKISARFFKETYMPSCIQTRDLYLDNIGKK